MTTLCNSLSEPEEKGNVPGNSETVTLTPDLAQQEDLGESA